MHNLQSQYLCGITHKIAYKINVWQNTNQPTDPKCKVVERFSINHVEFFFQSQSKIRESDKMVPLIFFRVNIAAIFQSRCCHVRTVDCLDLLYAVETFLAQHLKVQLWTSWLECFAVFTKSLQTSYQRVPLRGLTLLMGNTRPERFSMYIRKWGLVV